MNDDDEAAVDTTEVMIDARAIGHGLATALRARHEQLVVAAVDGLRAVKDAAARDLDATAAFFETQLVLEQQRWAQGRRPIAAAEEEVALMAPSNSSITAFLDPAKILLSGNRVRVRLTRQATVFATLVQEVFDDVVPGVVRFEHSLTGPEFLTEILESEAIPLAVIYGGERLGDEALRRARGGGRRKRVVFEGPGKDPAIILARAPVAETARALAEAKFRHAGQLCVAPENLIVDAGCHDELADALAAACRSQVVGEVDDPATDIGPLLSERVPLTVREQLDDAVRLGAQIVEGGRIEGQWVHPTVVTGVTPEMKLFQDETFAPVFALVAADGPAEAIELARNSRFGLTASVIGPGAEDVAAALRGASYAQPVPDIVYGRFGKVRVDGLRDTDWSEPEGGYGKSGWILDGDRLRQGPKSTTREATVAS